MGNAYQKLSSTTSFNKKKYDWEHENVVIRSSAKDYGPSIQAAVKNIESIRARVH